MVLNMNILLTLSLTILVFIDVNLTFDAVPDIPEGCMYGLAYSCYNTAAKVEEAGCTSWCVAVENKLRNDFNYTSGCRFGNAQRSHSSCREGRDKMKCRKCGQTEMTACCGSCKQDCDVDVVYLEAQ